MMMNNETTHVQLVPFVAHDGRVTEHLAADFADYTHGLDAAGYARGFVAIDVLRFDCVLVHVIDGEPTRVIGWPSTQGKTLVDGAARYWKLPLGGRQRMWFIYDNGVVNSPQLALARLRSLYTLVYGIAFG